MITTYQIRNVLRIYGNQLKKRTILLEETPGQPKKHSDIIDISGEARKKEMLNQVSNNIITDITRKDRIAKSGGNII